MPVSESKRRNNDKYNAKCDYISLRPIKPVGAAIRAAARVAGESVQGYVIQACADRMRARGPAPRSQRPQRPGPAPVTKFPYARKAPGRPSHNGPPGLSLSSNWSFHFLLWLNCLMRRSRLRLNRYDRTAPMILRTMPIHFPPFLLYSQIVFPHPFRTLWKS